jgi:dolichyl-diphosphooligosaccharide--protein glycosyltransferase
MRRERTLLAPAGLLALVAGSLALRMFPAWPNVFKAGGVRFAGPDAWYYARLIEYRVANFPHGLVHDPYLAQPGGGDVPAAPLFDFALAAAAWVLGLSHPSARLVGIVAAVSPAVLGALTVLPVFFLARRLWGTAAAWTAALLMAVLPGQFLARSLLGYTDHHVAESLLALLVVSALARAAPETPLRSAAAAGAWLGLYLLTWQGGALLVLVLLAWVVVQELSDAMHAASSAAPLSALVAFLVAGVFVLPFYDGVRVPSRHLIAIAGGVAITAGFLGLRRVALALRLSRGAGALVLLAAAALGLLASARLFPAVLADVRLNLARLWPSGGGSTVGEMVPLLDVGPGWLNVWREYSTAGAAAAAGLVLLVRRAIRRGHRADVLLAVWSVASLVFALGQRRFSYYFGVNVALLSGLAVSAAAGRLTGARAAGTDGARRGVARALVACGLVLALAGPSLRVALAQAARDLGPSDAWVEALSRLRRATPEPFGSDAAWLAPPGTPLPPSREGVLAWWDEGYWIMFVAHRVPVANPTQHGASVAATFFLSQDEAAATRVLERAGARTVLVSEDLVSRTSAPDVVTVGRTSALAAWAGEPAERYERVLEVRRPDGTFRPVLLYTPEYFRSMAVRLWTFPGGTAAGRERAWVFARGGADGRRIVELHEFASAGEATGFLRERPERGFEIASPDPDASCVGLDPVVAFDERRDVSTAGVRAYAPRKPGGGAR